MGLEEKKNCPQISCIKCVKQVEEKMQFAVLTSFKINFFFCISINLQGRF